VGIVLNEFLKFQKIKIKLFFVFNKILKKFKNFPSLATKNAS
jgi:hypothetical protein